MSENYTTNKLLVQHNNLINGRFDMSAHELRIFVYLLSQINKDDTDFKLCKLPVKYITNNDKPGGNDYKLIKQYAETLSKRTFKLERIVEKKIKQEIKYVKQYDYYNVFSMVRWLDDENHLQVKFNDDLKEFLLSLTSNFTKADLENINKIENVNAYRIYWLLRQYNTMGQRTIALDEFKEILLLEDKYPEFRHLKARILIPAQKDLEKTDMAFDFEPLKKGKTITSIKFTIRKNASLPKQLNMEEEIKQQIPTNVTSLTKGNSSGKQEKYDLAYYNLTTVWGLTDLQARDLLAKTTPAEILVKIAKLQIEGNKMKANKASLVTVGAFIYNSILEELKKAYFNSRVVVK
jgi:plasmid replication initiation protein